MKIRMYNVGFGDCFCLRDRGKSLLVDFGTSNSRIEGKARREVFDLIISIREAHMYCSNCDCCDGFRNGCTCKEGDIIAPSYYKDI